MASRHRLPIVRSSIMAVLLALATMVALPPSTASAAPYCGIRWGSLDKDVSDVPAPRDRLDPQTGAVNVRAGQHPCYDRLVIDIGARGYTASSGYTNQLRGGGSGLPLQVRGGAFLNIVIHDVTTPGSYTLANPKPLSTAGFRTFREVVVTEDFEAVAAFGLGVRARLPFRMFILPGPGAGSRLVIDVAHRW